MPVKDITQARIQRTADKKLDLDDAKALLQAAGKSVSKSEIKELEKALSPKNGEYTVAPEALDYLRTQLSQLNDLAGEAKRINDYVDRRAPGLAAEEKAILQEGVSTKSYGGSVVPEAVKKAMNGMLAAGATVYDVLQSEAKAERDEHDPTQWTLTGIWSPYGVQDSIPATGPMAFSYTELTPKAIEDDMKTSRDQVVLTGTKQESGTDWRTGKQTTWTVPTYEHRQMKGTGNIVEHYDEIGHSEPFALMSASEGYCKWDANFAVLADGTFHALPAMRRSDDPKFQNRILTNPSLARDKRMVFNGHIGMRDGVVTSIGISGRLQKLAASGDAKFVNPLPLLEAWGFKIAPGLRVQFEGSGSVKIDPQTNLIEKG